MSTDTSHQTEDIITHKLRRWERSLSDDSVWEIEPAARIEQLAGLLAEEMDQIAAAEGLSNQGDYQVLAYLRTAQHHGEAVTATDVSKYLGMTTATMVSRVDRLEKRGYAKRVPHPTDRRAINLAITPEGRASAERMVQTRTRDRIRWLAGLNKDEQAALTALLRKLSDRWTATRNEHATPGSARARP